MYSRKKDWFWSPCWVLFYWLFALHVWTIFMTICFSFFLKVVCSRFLESCLFNLCVELCFNDFLVCTFELFLWPSAFLAFWKSFVHAFLKVVFSILWFPLPSSSHCLLIVKIISKHLFCWVPTCFVSQTRKVFHCLFFDHQVSVLLRAFLKSRFWVSFEGNFLKLCFAFLNFVLIEFSFLLSESAYLSVFILLLVLRRNKKQKLIFHLNI